MSFDPLEVTLKKEEKKPDSAKQGTQILVRQPKRYSRTLVVALKDYFSTIPTVKSAYLLHVAFSEEDYIPHLTVAIVMAAFGEEVIKNAIAIAAPLLRDKYIYFTVIEENNELIRDSEPFYKVRREGSI